jgi:hypothetical protein
MGAAAPVVRSQIIGSDNCACIIGYKHRMLGRAPIGERIGAGDVARNGIGLPGPECRLQYEPDSVVVTRLGLPDQHEGSAFRRLHHDQVRLTFEGAQFFGGNRNGATFAIESEWLESCAEQAIDHALTGQATGAPQIRCTASWANFEACRPLPSSAH